MLAQNFWAKTKSNKVQNLKFGLSCCLQKKKHFWSMAYYNYEVYNKWSVANCHLLFDFVCTIDIYTECILYIDSM